MSTYSRLEPAAASRPLVAEAPLQTPGLRVLHVVLSLECGGMEQVVVDLIRLSRQAGQRAEVLCFDRLGELAGQLIDEGVPVHCLHRPAGFDLTIRKQLAQLLDSIRPDVIHTHQIGTLFYIGPPARKCGIKSILHTEHGKEYHNGWRTRLIGRLAARHVETFCCVSNDTAHHVLQNYIVPRRKIRIVYNGINLERFQVSDESRQRIRNELGISPDEVVVGTVGRLIDVKRQDVLVEGFAIASKTNPEAHLLLVGDGPERSSLEQMVVDRGLRSRVHFVGYQERSERYLSAMDVFTLTSDSEGTPLSLLEAWSVGLPVVVTAVGGMPELVEEEHNGLLVPRRDPAALANAFDALIHGASLRQRMGQAGRDTLGSRFDRRTMADTYGRMYENLLSR